MFLVGGEASGSSPQRALVGEPVTEAWGREARGRSRSCRKRAGRFLATAYNRHDRFRKPAVMTPKPVRKLSHLDAKGRPAMVDVSAKARSEERRVGQECGSTVSSRWAPDH